MKELPKPEEAQKNTYFNVPCYAYGTTGETKQLEQKTPTSEGGDSEKKTSPTNRPKKQGKYLPQPK